MGRHLHLVELSNDDMENHPTRLAAAALIVAVVSVLIMVAPVEDASARQKLQTAHAAE